MTERTWTIAEPGSWEIDSVHFPTPITAYHASILKESFPRGFAEGSARLGLLLSHFDHEVVHGFDYICPRIVGAPKNAKGPPPFPIFKLITWLHPAVRARIATQKTVFERKPWREDCALWENTIRAESTAKHLELQRFDLAKATDEALATHLETLRENAKHQYYVHHRFTISAFTPVGDFIVHAREWTGLDDGELMQACRQPKGVATIAETHFDAVVEEIRKNHDLRGNLKLGAEAKASLSRLSSESQAAREWLEMTGHRLVTGYDITDLTAYEMPELLLRTLLAALEKKRENRQSELAAKVRDKVPAPHRAKYDEILAEAISVSNLREERALVCDFWAYGLVRRAAQEAGRRLFEKCRLKDANHFFDASHEEMLALVRGGKDAPSSDELEARNAWRTSATCDEAPKRIGPAPSPPPPPDWYPPAVRRANAAVEAAVKALFDEPDPRSEPKVVRGLNASAGTYEGTARVVLRPDDFGRIEQGDVLIARMTTEAYNGILPLLGAVVTDRGGLLSHTATVAREFGIPAVVGTTNATRLIPDGARVRVDGGRGEARLV